MPYLLLHAFCCIGKCSFLINNARIIYYYMHYVSYKRYSWLLMLHAPRATAWIMLHINDIVAYWCCTRPWCCMNYAVSERYSCLLMLQAPRATACILLHINSRVVYWCCTRHVCYEEEHYIDITVLKVKFKCIWLKET